MSTPIVPPGLAALQKLIADMRTKKIAPVRTPYHVIPKAPSKYAPDQWTTEALVMLVIEQVCSGCGVTSRHSQGMFYRKLHKRTPAVWLQPVQFYPHHSGLPQHTETIQEHISACPECFTIQAAIQRQLSFNAEPLQETTDDTPPTQAHPDGI